MVRAYCILGRRSVRRGEVTVAYVQAQVGEALAEYLGDKDVPSKAAVWRWEKQEGDLPERLLAMGVLREEELPPWARAYLRRGRVEFQDEGQRSQSRAQGAPATTRACTSAVAYRASYAGGGFVLQTQALVQAMTCITASVFAVWFLFYILRAPIALKEAKSPT